jgi:membrane protein YqaA with SNARE-associated domain
MVDLAAYAGLFLVAFAAATIFPMQSEAGLVGLILTGEYSTVLLVAVASAGNVLGSVVNWLLGRGIERFREAVVSGSRQMRWTERSAGIAATASGRCWRAGCPSSAIPSLSSRAC